MSDHMMKEFGALLNTTLEAVLKRATFEIMKIFEYSLHDHQLELGRKGEEIVQLKVKLQRAELKLRDAVGTEDGGAEMNNQMIEAQREPEEDTTDQKPLVPEIDFEVPDDWCAPVGEDPTNPYDGVCPSVRLRRLSIPLKHVPIIKQEVAQQNIDTQKEEKGVRRSKRGSLSNNGNNQAQHESLTTLRQSGQHKQVRGDINILLHENAVRGAGLRRREKNSMGNEQDDRQSERQDRESEASNIKPAEPETTEKDSKKKAYTCKFCKKAFDCTFGLSVHVRSHKWCQGCKKEFPFPSMLTTHKSHCRKLQKKFSKKAPSSAAPEPTPSNNKVTGKEDSMAEPSQSSIHKAQPTKKFSCAFCGKLCCSGSSLQDHMRIHTGEKPFTCRVCLKKFRSKQALKLHVMRLHKDQLNSGDTNGGFAWTEPLEATKDSVSNSDDKRPHQVKKQTDGWQACGTRATKGYSCNLCSKLTKNRHLLIEHYRVHTREKPYECPGCHSRFRFRGQFTGHTKKCAQYNFQGDQVKLQWDEVKIEFDQEKFKCDVCGKKFLKRNVFKRHMSTHNRDWHISCKVCGKGFIAEAFLKKHMERFHESVSVTACAE
ncbi:zinc finger protein 260-like [Xyrichtys novacula]|uniref:Zinc finger protein 260-like n=1 Tax=Xyrichtys novacula TaxID=13765 RepID=A0AAV1FC95_XYRNO|nr:zinc finger protein 260-like [Xyrichtys novacula]